MPWSERDVSIIITINLALWSVGCGVSRRAITQRAGGSFLVCQTFVFSSCWSRARKTIFVTLVRNESLSARWLIRFAPIALWKSTCAWSNHTRHRLWRTLIKTNSSDEWRSSNVYLDEDERVSFLDIIDATRIDRYRYDHTPSPLLVSPVQTSLVKSCSPLMPLIQDLSHGWTFAFSSRKRIWV